MRWIKLFTLMLAIVSTSAMSNPISVSYSQARNQENDIWNQKLQAARFLERIASNFGSILELPPMRMTTRECGEANAYWTSQTRTMTLCLELVRQAEEKARSVTDDRQKSALLAGQMVQWVMAHELGHGLVDTLDLPVLGRGEDVADQIGTLIMLHSRSGAYGISGAMINFAGDGGETWDAHALNPQRQVNVACWAWGSDPRRYRYIAEHIPTQRKQSCGEEYRQVAQSFRRLMGKRLKIQLRGAG